MVVSSETYESKASCIKGIEAVKRLAADATVTEEEKVAKPVTNGRVTTSTAPA